jgi:hypothetical protein
MEILLQLFTTVALFTAGVLGQGATQLLDTQNTQVLTDSVELGLNEVSPNGEAGGFAIPASGCSPVNPIGHNSPFPIHDCNTPPDITVDKPIVRVGDPVTVSWDRKTHLQCVLSSNVMALRGGPNPLTAPDVSLTGSPTGSRIDSPQNETVYSIICQGTGNRDSVTVKVLPQIQES